MCKHAYYYSRASGGQGLIIDESTGRTIAVTYEEKDSPLLAAAPELLEALEEMIDLCQSLAGRTGDRIEYAKSIVAKAKGE